MSVIHELFLYQLMVVFFLLLKIINQVNSFISIKKKLFFRYKNSDDQAERQRIQEAGGTVLIQRVNGSLAVSRALGDFEYKNNPNRRPDQQLVSPEPEVTYYTHSAATKPDEQISFIVLACDGIWDVMTNEELATYILGRLHVTDDLCEIANSVLDMCLYKVCVIF
jgi:serine/threonine protein phosphatase PrpC